MTTSTQTEATGDLHVSHTDEMLKIERKRLQKAIVDAVGNLKHAAQALKMPHSTLTSRLARHHPALQERARKLRTKNGSTSGRGRPRLQDAERSKKVVAKAWRESKHSYAECARVLKIPASSVQMLVERYGLPNEKKDE